MARSGKKRGSSKVRRTLRFGGNLYITDYRNNRVQEFSTAGVHLGGFRREGGSESENGKFLSPYGIASDPSTGNLYVVDSGHHRVQEFTPAGSFITKFGSSGTGPGQFTTPQGVAVILQAASTPSTTVLMTWMCGRARNGWQPLRRARSPAAHRHLYIRPSRPKARQLLSPRGVRARPSGISCSAEPSKSEKGCRELTFKYAEKTTASGENMSQWGGI